MKYQVLKHLKTKIKVLKICNSLQEAHDTIKNEGASFQEFSYVGGYPVYVKNYRCYSIQGLVEGLNIVCSLNDKELKKFYN